ncbi:MAG TPA: hypothetical protein VKI44_13720 [Acetobacteraceae bacterium]|nr:hypothetical protein [Acetobacteraceae bacterium]
MPPELCWLPETPVSWSEALTALTAGTPGAALADGNAALALPLAAAETENWAQLTRLANYRLDGLATVRLDR